MKRFLIVAWLLLLSICSFAQVTIDPTYLGVGARALGMGKAYVAAADDGDAIFTNPAALGEMDYFKFSSMSGKILEDVNYTMLGGVYPLGDKMAAGLGLVGISVPGVEIRDAAGAPQSQSDYTSGALVASFGKRVTDDLSLGLNLKYFLQSATSDQDSNGAGANLDLGLLHNPNGFFRWGLVLQNVLVSSQLNYNNAAADRLPALLKLGSRLYLSGQGFGAGINSPLESALYADIDCQLQGNLPIIGHLGLEISPNQYFSFRSGIDQIANAAGVQNTLTGGVGLKFGGLAFNYAYHPYAQTGESGAHYFSLNYDERDKPAEPEIPAVHQACK